MGTHRLDRDQERSIDDEVLLGELRRSIATFDPVPARARSAAQLAFVVHRRRWWRGPAVASVQTNPSAEDRLTS